MRDYAYTLTGVCLGKWSHAVCAVYRGIPFEKDARSRGNTKQFAMTLVALYDSASQANTYTHSTCIDANIAGPGYLKLQG